MKLPWLCPDRYSNVGNLNNYDLAPDAKRLAAFVADDADRTSGEPTHLTFC